LIHDFRHSAVSLALCIDHEIAAAVIYLPFSDEVFHACKGQGAFLNGLPIHVSKTDMLQNSLISLGTNPYDRSFTNEDFTLFKNIFMQCRDIRRLGSAAMELAYVACGRLDAYIERGLKSWDYAAGGLLIKEAGGTITDYRGVEIDIEYTHNILSGNSKINDCLIQNIKDS
jgi:myo-inositol-1(or 4)-monophosphatase